MFRALQGILTMETSPLHCNPHPIAIAQWSPLHTLLLEGTLGTLHPVGFRVFSGPLRGGKGAGKGTIRGGRSVM